MNMLKTNGLYTLKQVNHASIKQFAKKREKRKKIRIFTKIKF